MIPVVQRKKYAFKFSISFKCNYVKKEGLAGAMIWTLDMDDFSGKFCKNGTFPVIRALKQCFDTPPTTTTTTTTTRTITSTLVSLTTEVEYSQTTSGALNYFFNVKHVFIIAIPFFF
jgi:chitinase